VRNRFEPVETYLKPQLRFRHLFEPVRQEEVLAEMQRRVDAYWAGVRRGENLESEKSQTQT
jgi:pyruvate ferredoxin oxidoreductase beta subunit